MEQKTEPRRPHWPFFCCYALVFASFSSHVFFLDRYPLPYVDEAFLYYPAIRALEGQGLTYKIRSDAPHGDSIWAYHAPFFPRTQVVAFWLMGISEFASRFTPYLAGHLAVLILCRSLLGAGLFRSAILVALAWIGDRSHYCLLFGRMEGICLLCETAGFIVLLKAVTTASTKGILTASFFAGVLLGLAVGFHPVAASFPACALVMLPLLAQRCRAQALLCLAAGGLVPIALIFICWLPSPSASLEQFRWTLRYGEEHYKNVTLSGQWLSFIESLGRSKYWFLVLSLATIWLIVPLARGLRGRGANVPGEELACKAFLLASAFSVCSLCGLLLIAGKGICLYYLVYFTIWPVVAIAVSFEMGRWKGTARLVLFGLGMALFVSWVPSLGFNVQRFLDAARNYDALDRNRFARHLRESIPEGASVTGCPQFILVARKAGIRFVPLPWYPESSSVPPEDYILLSEDTVLNGYSRVDPANLAARPLIREDSLAPGTKLRWSRTWLYGPMEAR